MGGNRIYRNKIEKVMQVLVDGGGIYIQSDQIDPASSVEVGGIPAGTVAAENFIDGVGLGLRVGDAYVVRRNTTTPAVAIYLDHGSENVTVVGNVWDDLAQAPFATPPPLFGPRDVTYRRNGYQSPCGFRAGRIDSRYNRAFDRNDPADLAIRRNAGARRTAAALLAEP
jgi:hypothetical protein